MSTNNAVSADMYFDWTLNPGTATSVTYTYTYNGGTLAQMTGCGDTLSFSYDASGKPMAVTWGTTTYLYLTNLQGDVIAILDTAGNQVVQYTYDAWGNILTTTGTLANTLGTLNPITYRGYVYDTETDLYYLQSRYYNPTIGRFLNADGYTYTGGLLGSNMFAYCANNPTNRYDPSGGSSLRVRCDDLNPFSAHSTYIGIGGGGGGANVGGMSAIIATTSTVITAGMIAGPLAGTLCLDAIQTRANRKDEVLVDSAVITNQQSDAYYYGADKYGGAWKLVTGPMDFDTALIWVGSTAMMHTYGKGASWGLYTPNRNDALEMAAALGGPMPVLHTGNMGEFPHFHVVGMDLFGQYKHFHIWYGSQNGR